MISIINYGLGNLRSIQKAFEKFGHEAVITSSTETIEQSEAIILPGVGAFGKAMSELTELNLVELLRKKLPHVPTLGICLGMQLLFEFSEESPGVDGLTLIKGKVKKMDSLFNVRIPHTGWNKIYSSKDPFFTGYAYFNHSFYCEPDNQNEIISKVIHGKWLPVIVKQGTILGVQFHPEKSQSAGESVIKYFLGQITREVHV